jgi:hypothetical protein
MSKVTALLKKALVAALILGIGLAAFPATRVFAAGLNDPSNPPGDHLKVDALLEKVWAREQTLYQRQDDRLAKADKFFTNVQSRIEQANQKGYDTSAIQSALDALETAVEAARPIHENAGSIIAAHAGFDANGKVTDRTQARETVKLLGQSLRDSHNTVADPFKALREAVKAFREAHKPSPQAPATTP